MNPSDGSRSTVERAIDIARNGSAASIRDIRDQLRSEGYESVEVCTSGLSIKAQLNKLIDTRLRPGATKP